MKTETIFPPNFKGRAAKIIAEINITCIDNTEILKELLQYALEEYYYEGRDDGYYAGRDDGYALGYDAALCSIVAYKRPRQP